MRGGIRVAASGDTNSVHRRSADRRSGVFQLVRQVAVDLVATDARRDLSALLVDRLSRLDGVRAIRLNEVSASMPSRSLQPIRARDYVAYVVPVKEPGRQVVLEAAFDAKRGPDGWTCQLLEACAYLAAMLIEAERLAQTPTLPRPADGDGAAPLIGASEVMCLLRDRVERVASTDFTVLIEGEIDPQ